MAYPKLLNLTLLALVCCGLTASLSYAETNPSSTVKNDIDEVVVSARRESDYSVITERAQKILDVPGSFGDPLMAAFSLPGVLSVDETGAPAVRGSSPSDNRYVVDGAPAGRVFHAFSTSVFNENIIQDFQLYSAGFGPSYSNAIGGVFDIKLREPKKQPLLSKVDVSFLHAGVFFEGAVTENSSFYLSARSSWQQLLFNDKARDAVEKEDGIRIQKVPQDSDFQFKYVYDINDNNKIKISANGATDIAKADFTNASREVLEDPEFAGDAKIDENYKNTAITWEAKGDKNSMFTLQVGQFVNNDDIAWGGKKYFSKIKETDSYLISHYDFTFADDHNLSVGGEMHRRLYGYDLRFIDYNCTEGDFDCLLRPHEIANAKDNLKLNDSMVFINDHWNVSDTFALDIGEQTQYNDFTKETFHAPRLAASWTFVEDWTLSSSLGQYNRFPELQYLFPEIGNPKLKSPTSNHFTVGLKHKMDDEWSWSTTAYYKTMDDLPLAMGVAAEQNYTNNVKGKAYGIDAFINKELTDRWYGWLAISASKSLRTNQLTNIETNYYLDTPVVINWAMNYKLTDAWSAGVRLTAQTGRAYTPVVGAQHDPNPQFPNHFQPVYGDAYSDNLPTYSRLDLRFKYEWTLWGNQANWHIDILNALNTKNVSERHLDYKNTTSPQNYKLKDEAGLGIMPDIGVSITF